MKKIVLLYVLVLISLPALAYSGGNGTEQNPYLISSKADMQQLASEVNSGNSQAGKHFLLTCDLTEITTMVGQDGYVFSGLFDGGGYRISTNINANMQYIGLFCYVNNATIKNIEISGHNLESISSVYFGGICGRVAGNTTITNCNVSNITGNISASTSFGGICGRVSFGNAVTITNCYNTGDITYW
jgi:hypothetical protein